MTTEVQLVANELQDALGGVYRNINNRISVALYQQLN